jgi:hypothetical protein
MSLDSSGCRDTPVSRPLSRIGNKIQGSYIGQAMLDSHLIASTLDDQSHGKKAREDTLNIKSGACYQTGSTELKRYVFRCNHITHCYHPPSTHFTVIVIMDLLLENLSCPNVVYEPSYFVDRDTNSFLEAMMFNDQTVSISISNG